MQQIVCLCVRLSEKKLTYSVFIFEKENADHIKFSHLFLLF